MADALRKIDLDMQRQGVRPDVINTHLTGAIVQAAIEQKDESILDVALMDRTGSKGEKIPGPGMTMDGRKTIDDARIKIRKLKQGDQDRQRELEDELKKADRARISQSAMADGFAAFKAGKGFTISPRDLEDANKLDPDFAKDLLEIQQKMNTYNSGTEDSVARAELEAKAANGILTESELMLAVKQNQLRDPVAISKLFDSLPHHSGRGAAGPRHADQRWRQFHLNIVKEWLGHTNISTTMRYAHLAPDNLRSAMEALDS